MELIVVDVPHQGLRAKLLKAGLWIVSGHVLQNLIGLSTSLIMTRLLVPEDFGLMAIATAIPVGLEMLTDVGIRSNVIRKSGTLGPDFLRTAWTIQAVRGVALWMLVLVLAALLYLPQVRQTLPAGSLLAHPELPLVLAVTGSTLAIASFGSVNIYLQARDIQFRPLVLRSLISKLTPVPVIIVWALLFPSVWSLVAGVIVAYATATLLSHILIPGVPMKFSWNRDHAQDILKDGKWIGLSTAANFVGTQSDRLILALFLTASQMGLYVIAWSLVNAVRSLLQSLDGQITLPILSELFRTRPANALELYYKYRKPIEALAFTVVGFLWIVGPELIDFLYDDRYTEAGWMLQVFALSLLPLPYLIINSAFIAHDEWRSFSVNSVVLGISLFTALFVGYSVAGWTGIIWGTALYGWPAAFILLWRGYRRGWCDPIREIALLPLILVGIALGYATLSMLQ